MKTNSESNAQYLQRTFDLVQLRERNSAEWSRFETGLQTADSFVSARYSDQEVTSVPVSRSLFLAYQHEKGAVCRIPGRQYGDKAYVVVSNMQNGFRYQKGPEWYTLDGAKSTLLRYVKLGIL